MADKNFSDLAKGAWLIGTAYTIGDIVDHESSSYACIADSTGDEPPNASFWALYASGIDWQGDWSAGTYTLKQAVAHEGKSWICNAATTTEEPTGTPTDWDLLADKGDTGATGAQGAQGDQGIQGDAGTNGSDGDDGISAGLPYDFDVSTVDGDPGAGKIRFNHATLSSVTQLFIDNLEKLTGDVSAFIDTWDDSTNTALRGTITIREKATPANFVIYNVTGAVTDGTGYRKVVVTYVDHNGSFADTDELTVEFSRTGNKGTDGAGAGDVVGPGSATDNALAQYDGATGKLIKDSAYIPTTLGGNLINLANPSAIRFMRVDADNGVTLLADSAFRTAIGLAIGSDVQAWDADLDTIAGLTATTDNFMVSVASAWASRTPAQVRTTLGLVIGTNVQAWDADLDALAGLTSAANKIPYFTGSAAAALLDFKDEDNMVSDSATALASQQSIKAYVDITTKTIVLLAGSLSPTTTAGCADAATVEAGTNDVDYKVLDFDQTTEENCFIAFQMPDSWDGGTITAKFTWTTAASSGDVIWGIKGRAYADNDAIDQAYGTAQVVTDSFLLAGDVHISSATSAITLAGSPAGGQWVQLKVYRDADAGGDTLNGDARLISVTLEYTLDSNSD